MKLDLAYWRELLDTPNNSHAILEALEKEKRETQLEIARLAAAVAILHGQIAAREEKEGIHLDD